MFFFFSKLFDLCVRLCVKTAIIGDHTSSQGRCRKCSVERANGRRAALCAHILYRHTLCEGKQKRRRRRFCTDELETLKFLARLKLIDYGNFIDDKFGLNVECFFFACLLVPQFSFGDDHKVDCKWMHWNIKLPAKRMGCIFIFIVDFEWLKTQ
jgi:hypothetical protein